jgi:hypothetical protein
MTLPGGGTGTRVSRCLPSQDAPIAQQSAPTMTSDFLSFHHVVLLWAGLVIGLAMILIVIAMGVGDR